MQSHGVLAEMAFHLQHHVKSLYGLSDGCEGLSVATLPVVELVLLPVPLKFANGGDCAVVVAASFPGWLPGMTLPRYSGSSP